MGLLLKNIDDSFPELVKYIQEKEITDSNGNVITENKIAKTLSKECYAIVLGIYQFISNIAVNEKTIYALNNQDFTDTFSSKEFELQNLTFLAKSDNFNALALKSEKMFRNEQNKLIKSLISHAVVVYYYDHDVPLYGKAEQYAALLFDKDERKKIRLAKYNRLLKK